MLFQTLFELIAALGRYFWFVWPFTFVFGLTRAIFYMHPQGEEDEEGRDTREKRMVGGEILSGASLLVLFCALASLPAYL